jgi:hypothetical protein
LSDPDRRRELVNPTTSQGLFFSSSILPLVVFNNDTFTSSKMLSLLAIAPYAVGLAFIFFVYFLAYPYYEYLRDPKGMLAHTILYMIEEYME